MITPDNGTALYRDLLYGAGSSITWFALLGCVLAVLMALPFPAGAETLATETKASDSKRDGKEARKQTPMSLRNMGVQTLVATTSRSTPVISRVPSAEIEVGRH
jgi:hypothetical protein